MVMARSVYGMQAGRVGLRRFDLGCCGRGHVLVLVPNVCAAHLATWRHLHIPVRHKPGCREGEEEGRGPGIIIQWGSLVIEADVLSSSHGVLYYYYIIIIIEADVLSSSHGV